jgi:hypothetical protein
MPDASAVALISVELAALAHEIIVRIDDQKCGIFGGGRSR